MAYGIIDENFSNMLARDLREADWQAQNGDPKLATHLRADVARIQATDEAVRHIQAASNGLLPDHNSELCGICTNDGEWD